jgi:hypothetical protein
MKRKTELDIKEYVSEYWLKELLKIVNEDD